MLEFKDHTNHVDSIISAIRDATDPKRILPEILAHIRETPNGSVISIGKAAPAMFEAHTGALGKPDHRFMLIPEGVDAPSWALRADHPLPSPRNIAAASSLINFINAVDELIPIDEPVTLLLSGGASALLTLPADPIPLDEYRALTQTLLRSGADIHQLNCVRRHAEQLKGGRLARLLSPRPIHAFILSDVIGDDLSVIGSGPVSPDPTTYADAIKTLDALGVPAHAFPTVHNHLDSGARGDIDESPKPGDPIFDHVSTRVIANNAIAVKAAADAARSLGFQILEARTDVTGEADNIGVQLAHRAIQSNSENPTAVILGGETTVQVGASTGRGGPCTHCALAAAIELSNHPDIVIATFATDGVDGPTDAAGATATIQTIRDATSRGSDPLEALKNHDSHSFFHALNALTRTGPTCTNVNDIMLALRY